MNTVLTPQHSQHVSSPCLIHVSSPNLIYIYILGGLLQFFILVRTNIWMPNLASLLNVEKLLLIVAMLHKFFIFLVVITWREFLLLMSFKLCVKSISFTHQPAKMSSIAFLITLVSFYLFYFSYPKWLRNWFYRT